MCLRCSQSACGLTSGPRHFELRGNLNAGQEAYLDPTCNELITPGIRAQVSRFFRGVDVRIVECLRAKGYDVTMDDKIGFDASGVPGDVVRACVRQVFTEYS